MVRIPGRPAVCYFSQSIVCQDLQVVTHWHLFAWWDSYCSLWLFPFGGAVCGFEGSICSNPPLHHDYPSPPPDYVSYFFFHFFYYYYYFIFDWILQLIFPLAHYVSSVKFVLIFRATLVPMLLVQKMYFFSRRMCEEEKWLQIFSIVVQQNVPHLLCRYWQVKAVLLICRDSSSGDWAARVVRLA